MKTTVQNRNSDKLAKVLHFPATAERADVEIHINLDRQDGSAATIARGIRGLQQLERFGEPKAAKARIALAAFDNALGSFKDGHLDGGLQCLNSGWLAIQDINTETITRYSKDALMVAFTWLKGAFDCLLQHYINTVNHPGKNCETIDHLKLAENCLLQSSRAAVTHLVRAV